MSRALNYLGLARASGNLAIGEESAGGLVRAGKARLLLLASDASDGTKRRASNCLIGFHAPLLELPFTKAELGHAVGRGTCAVAAVRDLGLAKSLAAALTEEYGERYAAAAEALTETQTRIASRAAKGKQSAKRRKRE